MWRSVMWCGTMRWSDETIEMVMHAEEDGTRDTAWGILGMHPRNRNWCIQAITLSGIIMYIPRRFDWKSGPSNISSRYD